jgi:hypothetical protein
MFDAELDPKVDFERGLCDYHFLSVINRGQTSAETSWN